MENKVKGLDRGRGREAETERGDLGDPERNREDSECMGVNEYYFSGWIYFRDSIWQDYDSLESL